MKRQVVGVLGTAAAVVLGLVTLVVLLNLTVYLEVAVPPEDDLPELPAGLTIADQTDGCGSGNCYREFDVVGAPGESAASIRSRLPAREECSARSIVDRRRLCVGYRVEGDGVRGYVSLGRWWG